MTRANKPQGPSKINMIAPIALILIAYSYGFHSPQQAKLQKESTRLENLIESAHDTEHALADNFHAQAKLKPEIRKLRQTLASEQTRLAGLLGERAAMRHVLLQPSRPVATMQEITGLLAAHDLRVLESTLENQSQPQAKAALEPLLKLLSDQASHKATQTQADSVGREVYRMKLSGRFDDLRRALQALAAEQDQVIPLSVEMEPLELEASAGKSATRYWVLQLMV